MPFELEFPYPGVANVSRRAVWNGSNFKIDDATRRVLSYDVGESGWTEDLTRLHEGAAGSNHFIDVASRAYALEEVKRTITRTPSRILEVGCSSGFFLHQLIKGLPGHVIIGSDYTLPTLNTIAPTVPDVPLLQFDLTRCPLPDQFIDTAILINVLEHIDDDEAAVSQLFRILRPGGAVVIEVPASGTLFDVYDRALMHFRRYDMNRLTTLLTKSGFVIDRRSHLGFLVYPAFYLSKRLNQIRYPSNAKLDERKIILKLISSTEKASALMTHIMSLEALLRKRFFLPFGIRCLVTVRKPT
jgi:SAM-dependent methyltransferase